MKTYEDFLNDLGARESNGKYNIENSLGYLGKYQFGNIALIDIGYKNKSGWTGKNGIYSKNDFLNNSKIQELAIREYQKNTWKYIVSYNLHLYVGKVIKNIKITPSGLLAGYHLKGIGKSFKNIKRLSEKSKGLRCFLESNGVIDGKDGYGTSISEYIKKFSNYKTPFDI